MIVLGVMVAPVRLAPERRLAAYTAEVERITMFGFVHLAPIAVKHRAKRIAKIARYDSAVV